MRVVSGDPRIAPSAARVRSAFLAGLRPRTRWLSLGGLALVLLVFLGGREPGELAGWAGVHELDRAPAGALDAAVGRLVSGTVAIAGVVLLVVALVALATGGLGLVSTADRRRLSLGPIGLRAGTAIGGSVGILILALAILRGTVAGAARAPAASEAGLTLLWGGTALRVLAVMAGLLALAGVLELVASRWANRRALFQTEAQARSEARSGGGRRA